MQISPLNKCLKHNWFDIFVSGFTNLNSTYVHFKFYGGCSVRVKEKRKSSRINFKWQHFEKRNIKIGDNDTVLENLKKNIYPPLKKKKLGPFSVSFQRLMADEPSHCGNPYAPLKIRNPSCIFFSSIVNACTPASCCQATKEPTELGVSACCNIKMKRAETRLHASVKVTQANLSVRWTFAEKNKHIYTYI